MFFADPYTVDRLSSLYQDSVQKKAQHRMLQCRAEQQGQQALARSDRRLLSHVGHQLVLMGRWLEQISSPQLSH